MSKDFDKVINYISRETAASLYMIDTVIKEKITEIRIRIDRPICLTIDNSTYFLSIDGNVSQKPWSNPVVTDRRILDECFMLICNNSVYTYEQELANAFVTLACGSRVGVFGETVCMTDRISSYKNITSLNYRIPREFLGSARPLKDILCNRNGVIISGPPASSKTTILRDSIRMLASEECGYKRVSVIDTRNEIAAINKGKIGMNLGVSSDVISMQHTELGIETAVRVMNPEYIALDEIVSQSETDALLKGTKCGIKLIATMHSGSVEELINKNTFKMLVNNGAVDCAVFIKKAGAVPEIISIK